MLVPQTRSGQEAVDSEGEGILAAQSVAFSATGLRACRPHEQGCTTSGVGDASPEASASTITCRHRGIRVILIEAYIDAVVSAEPGRVRANTLFPMELAAQVFEAFPLDPVDEIQ